MGAASRPCRRNRRETRQRLHAAGGAGSIGRAGLPDGGPCRRRAARDAGMERAGPRDRRARRPGRGGPRPAPADRAGRPRRPDPRGRRRGRCGPARPRDPAANRVRPGGGCGAAGRCTKPLGAALVAAPLRPAHRPAAADAGHGAARRRHLGAVRLLAPRRPMARVGEAGAVPGTAQTLPPWSAFGWASPTPPGTGPTSSPPRSGTGCADRWSAEHFHRAAPAATLLSCWTPT